MRPAFQSRSQVGEGKVASLASKVRRTIHRFGWDLHHYDPDRTLETYLSTLLPDLGVNCVIDVGARIGEFGLTLRAIGYRGHILSFEPVRENFETLKRVCADDAQWMAYPYALGSDAAESTMNVTEATNFSSFLPPSNFGQNTFPGEIAIKRKESVSIRRLDMIFREVTASIDEPVIYLKMDTQGWDVEVLRGAAGCLDRIVAAQSEMSLISIYDHMPKATEAMTAFEDAGFFASAMYPVSRDRHRRLLEFDCIMVRRGSDQEQGSSH